MLVDISPPVRTRAVGVQVVQGRRHGQGDGLGTWVCDQRMSEPKPATNGVREIVVVRRRRAGQRLMDDMKIIISNRTSMFYMRMIPGKMRMGEVYADVYGSITFATFGVTPVKGARSHVTTCPGRRDRRAMLVDISPPV